MRKKLFLFDIDGTLLTSGPLPRLILNRVLRELTGGDPELRFQDVAGLTDRMIISAALRKCGVGDGDLSPLIERVLARYLEDMQREYPGSDQPRLYQDALALLDAAQSAGHVTALLTGNVEAGARIKLERFDLFRRFAFGVFGNDSAERADLPALARQRARERLGLDFPFSDLVIVGDTPNDARVAALCGARSLIVCRRPGWEDEIRAAGADIVVEDLSAALALVDGGR